MVGLFPFMKQHKFLIAVLLLFSFFTPSHAGDIFNSFWQEYPRSGKIESNGLNYSLDHLELLRASRNDTLLSRYTIRQQHIKCTQKLKDINYRIDYHRNILDINDLFNNDYTRSTIKPDIQTIEGKIQFRMGHYLLIPGLGFSFSTFSDTLFIKKYPVSEERIYNDYFFDLLPGTFGDSILYNNTYNKFNSNLYIERMNATRGFSLYLDYSITHNKLNERHWNLGDVNQLQGPRESLVHFKTINFNSLVLLKVDTNAVLKLGMTFNHTPIDWSHTVFPNDPDTLEIIKLNSGKLNSFSGTFAYAHTNTKTNFDLSLRFGRTGGSSHLATPVLGYVFSILPIAHQGDITLTTHYIQFRSHIDHSFNMGIFELTPRFDIISGYYFSHLNALALLQFGIEDINIDKQYQHIAIFASPGINSKFFLNSDLHINLNISQLIPFIKQLKPEPIPVEPGNIKYYGGLSISMGVGMTW